MEGRTKRIRGLVIPWKWDESGNIKDVIIASRDETEYQVDLGPTTIGLISLLHRMVELEGEIDSNGTERPVVRVVKYKLIETTASGPGFNDDSCPQKVK